MLARKLVCVGAMAALAVQARAGIIFTDDFQQDYPKSGWSTGTLICLENEKNFTWFNGRYSGNQSTTLTLAAPPPPKTGSGTGGPYNLFTVTFDLFILDSWDGNDTNLGPDRFSVKANGATIFSETFANQHNNQSARRPDVGPIQLGFDSRYNDSIYRKFAKDFTIPDTATTIVLNFGALGLQGLNDESWGIDNVKVEYKVVPAPGAAAMVMGLAGVMGFRRRR